MLQYKIQSKKWVIWGTLKIMKNHLILLHVQREKTHIKCAYSTHKKKNNNQTRTKEITFVLCIARKWNCYLLKISVCYFISLDWFGNIALTIDENGKYSSYTFVVLCIRHCLKIPCNIHHIHIQLSVEVKKIRYMWKKT